MASEAVLLDSWKGILILYKAYNAQPLQKQSIYGYKCCENSE